MRIRSHHGTKAPARLLVTLLLAASLAALAALVTPQPLQALPAERQHHIFRKQIEQIEEQWRSAVLHNDGALLNSLLADDFTAITSNGAMQSRDEIIAAINSGQLQITSLDISERKIRLYGTTAVVTSVADLTGSRGDREMTGRYRYTRVYVRNAQGQWKIVSYESSRVLEPAQRREKISQVTSR